MKKNILTKERIEDLALTILKVLHEQELDNALCIYYNNKRISTYGEFNKEGEYVTETKIEENKNPHNYFQYCAFDHIISISTEGRLYDKLNYGSGEFPQKLEKLFKELGIYYEMGNSWNLSFYPIDDNMEIEYTYYENPDEKEIVLSYGAIGKCPPEIENIMQIWYMLSTQQGDIGACVLGASVNFEYQNQKYKMLPCSPWQGEGSWTPYVELVCKQLQNVGATNIKWNPGMLD